MIDYTDEALILKVNRFRDKNTKHLSGGREIELIAVVKNIIMGTPYVSLGGYRSARFT